MRVSVPNVIIVSHSPLTRALLADLLRSRFGIRANGMFTSLAECLKATPAQLIVWDNCDDLVPRDLDAPVLEIDAGTSVEGIVGALRKALRAEADTLENLTAHEVEVLLAVAAGQRNAEIARRQRRSSKTVEKHRASLQRKLGMHNVAQLTAYALRTGLLEMDAILAPHRKP